MYALNDLDLVIVENKKRFEELVEHYPAESSRPVIKEDAPKKERFSPLRFLSLSKLFRN